MEDLYVTRDFFHELNDKLDKLKKDSIKIAGQIEEARLLGDLKENAEYHAAKEAQAHNAARRQDLEDKISRAKIIEDMDIPSDKIYIGAFATVRDLKTKEEVTYQLLSAEESDFDNNKISIVSPIGKGLLGKGEGEKVEIEVPAGKIGYEILKIERSS